MINLNEVAYEFLYRNILEEVNHHKSMHDTYVSTIKFIGSIAAVNQQGLLYPATVTEIMEPLTEAEDERFTIFINNLATNLILHLNTVVKDGYLTLLHEIRFAVTTSINSDSYPAELRSRVDVDLLDDANYLTFYLLHPACRKLLFNANAVMVSRGIGNEEEVNE